MVGYELVICSLPQPFKNVDLRNWNKHLPWQMVYRGWIGKRVFNGHGSCNRILGGQATIQELRYVLSDQIKGIFKMSSGLCSALFVGLAVDGKAFKWHF